MARLLRCDECRDDGVITPRSGGREVEIGDDGRNVATERDALDAIGRLHVAHLNDRVELVPLVRASLAAVRGRAMAHPRVGVLGVDLSPVGADGQDSRSTLGGCPPVLPIHRPMEACPCLDVARVQESITRSLDLVGDRWGLLVVREILRGVNRFNELERSLPGISRSTLVQRLRHLAREAIVERHVEGVGRFTEYHVTDAGRDLTGVLDAMGVWGVRWLVPHRRPSEVDPDGLMRWIRRHVVLGELPDHRVVIRFELQGRSRRYFWLILRAGEVSLCPEHPGFEEDLFVWARPIDLYRLVVGQQSLSQAMDEGSVRVDGASGLVRSLPRWFLLRASGPPISTGSTRA